MPVIAKGGSTSKIAAVLLAGVLILLLGAEEPGRWSPQPLP
jgi:hypothetical protein